MPEKFSARMVKWFDSKTFEWKGCDSSRILKVRYYRIGKLQEDSERSRCNKQSKRSKNKNSQSLHGHYATVTVEQWPEDVASNRSIQDHPTHYFQVREECTACSSMTGSQIALPRILIPFHSIPIHESPFIGPLELRFDGPIRWSFMSLSILWSIFFARLYSANMLPQEDAWLLHSCANRVFGGQTGRYPVHEAKIITQCVWVFTVGTSYYEAHTESSCREPAHENWNTLRSR